jgi:hypothetical protein
VIGVNRAFLQNETPAALRGQPDRSRTIEKQSSFLAEFENRRVRPASLRLIGCRIDQPFPSKHQSKFFDVIQFF